jgi:hypothetical protein
VGIAIRNIQIANYMDCILLPEVLQQRSWQEPEAAKSARFLFDMNGSWKPRRRIPGLTLLSTSP